jgi:hypothetical protein
MDAFVDSEDYRFFHGAIITLSKKFNTHIIDDNKDNAYPLKK